VDAVGIQVPLEGVGADLEVRAGGRKGAGLVERSHDLACRLSRKAQRDADRSLVRTVEPVVAEPDHENSSVLEQPVEVPPFEVFATWDRAPAILARHDGIAQSEHCVLGWGRMKAKALAFGHRSWHGRAFCGSQGSGKRHQFGETH
jgi:hypothetical protein